MLGAEAGSLVGPRPPLPGPSLDTEGNMMGRNGDALLLAQGTGVQGICSQEPTTTSSTGQW